MINVVYVHHRNVVEDVARSTIAGTCFVCMEYIVVVCDVFCLCFACLKYIPICGAHHMHIICTSNFTNNFL